MAQHKTTKKVKILQIAVAGTGAVGRSLIERLVAVQQSGELPIRLVAVASRRPKPWLKSLNVDFVDRPVLLAERSDVDVVIEVLGGVQTAYELASAALSKGKHVVTANSTMLAGYGENLLRIAQMNNCYFGFEAAVLAGLPLRSFFTSIQQDVPRVTAMLAGGINRTLQRMQVMQETFDTALHAIQQELPVDPSGKEDLYRLALLRALLYGRWSNVRQLQGLELADLATEDLALVSQLGGMVQVLGMVNAGGISLQPMVMPTEQGLPQVSSKQESILLELPVGPVQVTAPMRCAATAVASLMNDLSAAQSRRAWKLSTPAAAQQGLETGCLFVRFNRVDQDLLRRDNRWSVMQERIDGARGKVGAIVATSLSPTQLMAALPNSLALPVWQPQGQEVQPLTTPLRLVS